MIKALAFAGVFVAGFSAGAFAQEKTVTLTMTMTEAQAALNEIGKAPWKDVNPLMQKLIAQLNVQLAPSPPPPPPPPSE